MLNGEYPKIDVCSSFQLPNQKKEVKIELKYIAVDIGKRDCKACIMSSDGSIAEETKYNHTLSEAEIFACSMVKKYGKCVAVCESTANLWLKTYQAFEKYNIAVKLANPLKTKAIAEAKIKTDTLDARTLAHLVVL